MLCFSSWLTPYGKIALNLCIASAKCLQKLKCYHYCFNKSYILKIHKDAVNSMIKRFVSVKQLSIASMRAERYEVGDATRQSRASERGCLGHPCTFCRPCAVRAIFWRAPSHDSPAGYTFSRIAQNGREPLTCITSTSSVLTCG